MKKILLILIVCTSFNLHAQVENIPVSNPVYQFLARFETKGVLEHKSLASLPLQKHEVVRCLELIAQNKESLTNSDNTLLAKYLQEFSKNSADERAVLFYSPSDDNQVFSSNFFSNKEKYLYHYSYDDTNISLVPLGAMDLMVDQSTDQHALIGTMGVRFSGTLTGNFGYSIEATNGRVLSGERDLALHDRRYSQSIKFAKLEDDIDLTESHINYQSKWFFASIGRQTLLEGSGLRQRTFISNSSPAMDALTLAAKFSNFEYKFVHASLVGKSLSTETGMATQIPAKYMGLHKFSLRPSWGEVSFIEQVIYSNRNTDLAYLNPLGFLKSIEHALRDRDNSLMGLFFTVRPIDNIQFKLSYLLDDLIFEKIGTGYWSNKMAYNFALEYSTPYDLDLGAEYSRVEPYTFSHFNVQNSVTNDSRMIGSDILPNSDRLLLSAKYWIGQRYPIELAVSYSRHGKNIFDGDSLIYNAGGDVLQTRRWFDSMEIDFLTGHLEEIFDTEISAGYELFRGLSILAYYRHRINNGKSEPFGRIIFKFESF